MYHFRYYAIGHSYLKHGPFDGWQTSGAWGMAASAPDKDYFHCLQSMLKAEFECAVDAIAENHANYERLCKGGATVSDYQNSESYTHMRDVLCEFRPNIITIFVGGGNTVANDEESLTLFFDVLLDMVNQHKPHEAVVVCISINEHIHSIFRPVIEKYHFIDADASIIHKIPGRENPYYAFRDYPEYDEKANNGAVEFRTHPNDNGHKKIAELIYAAAKSAIKSKISEHDDVIRHKMSTKSNFVEQYEPITEPHMNLTLNGFNQIAASDYVGFSSAPGTGASVTAENLNIGSENDTFCAEMDIEATVGSKKLLLDIVTATGHRQFRTALVDGINLYEFNISSVKETITGFRLSPDADECFVKLKSLKFCRKKR